MDTESNEILIEEDFCQEEIKKGVNSLVGKLHFERFVSKEVFKNTMVKVWRISKPFSIIDICPNIFIVKFENQKDKHKVVMGRPWLLDNFLFSLK